MILAFRRRGTQILQKACPLPRTHSSVNGCNFCMCSCHFIFLKTISKNLKIKSVFSSYNICYELMGDSSFSKNISD